MGPDRLRTFEGVEPMGRGRAKAKQVKVARQLKYKSSDGSDLERLRAEIAAGTDSHNGKSAGSYDDDEDDETRDLIPAEDGWTAPRQEGPRKRAQEGRDTPGFVAAPRT